MARHGLALGLAAIGVPPPGVATVAEGALARWQEAMETQALTWNPVWTHALLWLRANLPANDRVTLVHGDLRPGNTLVENGEVSAVLDWELAHIGDPLEDLGWWTVPTTYEREHFIAGVWEHSEFLEDYERLAGVKVDRDALQFYRALSVWKLETIIQTGIRAFVEGRTDRPAAPTTMMTALLAEMTGV